MRYFAVVNRNSTMGYALDYYPSEKRLYQISIARSHERILDDCATREEAWEVIKNHMLMVRSMPRARGIEGIRPATRRTNNGS